MGVRSAEWCVPFAPDELVTYHEIARAYNYAPHEMLWNRRDREGEAVHPAGFVFDILCWRAAAKLRSELTPQEVDTSGA
jgi:hypothetical protein